MASVSFGADYVNVAASKAFAFWVETEGAALVREAKTLAPRRTGKLADSVRLVRVNQYAVRLIADAASDGNRTRLASGGPFGSYAEAVIHGRRQVLSTTAWRRRYGGYGVLTPPPRVLYFNGKFSLRSGPAKGNDFLSRAVAARGLRMTSRLR